MKFSNFLVAFLLISLTISVVNVDLQAKNLPDPYTSEIILTKMAADTIPLKDRFGDFINDKDTNPFDITTKEIKQTVEYDPISGQYVIFEKIGDQYYRTPTYMTYDEYLDYKSKEQERNYFNNLAGIKSDKKSRTGKIDPMDKISLNTSLIDRLFGGNEINIKPQGSVDLSMGVRKNTILNPNLLLNQQRQPLQIEFNPVIKMNVDGKIGKKLDLGFAYDTQSTFDFDRKIKLAFDSNAFSEDDIIKKIEAGNVSFPLRGNLITGAQSLLGLKTELQFGRLRVTALASQQRSKANNVRVSNGGSVQEFEITPDQYDENKHFFISHYNRDNYERSLERLPFINTSFQIAQIEVWISDDRPEFQNNTTMVAAIADLAEPETKYLTSSSMSTVVDSSVQDELKQPLPLNSANNIYERISRDRNIVDIDQVTTKLRGEYGLRQTFDFEVFRGRRLSSSEFTYNPKLGTISLNSRLRPNQVLGVGYNYYFTSKCDSLFQVGQLAVSSIQPGNQTDTTRVEPPKVHFVKLIKSTNQLTTSPMWDLMMKNVYNLNTSQLNQQDFELDVFYEDDFSDGSLKKYIPLDSMRRDPILQLFNLDRLNRFNDPQPDGYFDYVPGVTVIERSGSIAFPVLEPFGKFLEDILIDRGVDPAIIPNFVFKQLYDTTIIVARQDLSRNKFRIIGRVKSTAQNGEIQLAPFVPPGSVRVRAGGKTLIENQDYEIDYNRGLLRILNPTYLAGGTPIDVSYEDNGLFSLQQKNMMGLRAEYQFNKQSSLGLTYLRLAERPFTQKVDIGNDPINNRMIGLDFNYSGEAPWVTKLIDKLPFYSTTEKSLINITGEAALLLPGHARAIDYNYRNSRGEQVTLDQGIANIDDFEGAINGFNLGGINVNQWALASTPTSRFPEGRLTNNIASGFNRALFNWYILDQGFPRNQLDSDDPYTRTLQRTELYPQSRNQPGLNQLFTFDLSYYPSERGPYNYEPSGGSSLINSKGFSIVDDEIRLNSPRERWGGIMRYFPNSDFQASNYESIEFWMLNPFTDRRDGDHINNEEGEFVFNLGSISEDIINDELLFFENALPTTQRREPTKPTNYGRASVSIPLVNGFDLTDGPLQDLGFDGMDDNNERTKFLSYLTDNNLITRPSVALDPANDNFISFNDPKYANETFLLKKMKGMNGSQGNAPLLDQTSDLSVRGNSYPETEDLNNNKSLESEEAYYEYTLKLKNLNGEMDTVAAGDYYRQTLVLNRPNGRTEKWYRMQIPLNSGINYNGIEGLRNIQFMRVFMTGFETPKTLRLVDFQLQRSQWIKQPPRCNFDGGTDQAVLALDDVSIEENSSKTPFNYQIPPTVRRTNTFSTIGQIPQDEKSMAMRFKSVLGGCEVSMTKLSRINIALYKRLQLFVHAENLIGKDDIKDDDLAIFVRVGKDFPDNSTNTGPRNYYEYELPLKLSKLRNIPADSIQTAHNIWPEANYIDIPIDSLIELKRIRYGNAIPSGLPIKLEINPNKKDTLTLVGNPSLGEVKVFQIGIKNRSVNGTNALTGEVWVNELRMIGYNEDAALAAQSKIQITLADLGEINLSGNYSSAGFGGIDQRLHERSREQTVQYDVSANINAGKLLPKELALNVPVFAQYQKTVITPQFDPFDRDIELKEKLAIIPDANFRDTIRDRSREVLTIKTFNVTNVKTTAGGTGKPWSPSNLSATYAFTETKSSDPIIKQDKTVSRTMGLDYIYNRKSNYIEPFKFIKLDFLKILSDFNFSILPNNFSFTSRMVNITNERTFRQPDVPVFVFDDQRFNWDRNYVLDWDLSRSLRFNFRANTTSVIDQLRQVGIGDTKEDRTWVDQFGNENAAGGNTFTQNVIDDPNYVSDYRNRNIRRLGRSRNYTHNISLNYRVPFKNIPYMDWINATIDYKTDYSWDAGSLIFIDELNTPLGNTIKNGQNTGFNVTFGFDKLYNKFDYLKSIETGKAVTKRSARKPVQNDRMNRGITGKDAELQIDKMPDGKVADSDKKGEKDGKKEKEKKEDKPRVPTMVERVIIRPLMMVRSVKVNYKEDNATILPGFMPQSSLLGLADGFNAPGLGFAAGAQPNLIGDNNWLLKNQAWFNPSANFNSTLSQSKRHTLDIKILVEPFKDFSVDVSFRKNYTQNHTEVFRTKAGEFMQFAGYDVGSFDASFFSLNTLFTDYSVLYERFKENREIISRRLPNIENPGTHITTPAYAGGYGPTHNSVAVPAFLAAYTDQSPFDIPLDQPKQYAKNSFIPRPNWQVNYTGLSKLGFLKSIFSNITIKHGYVNNIRVNDFQSSPNFRPNDPFGTQTPNFNYWSRLEIPSVSIQESFVPIIGLSLKTNSDFKLDFEYKKSRGLELGPAVLRENLSSEIVLGAGYVIKNFRTNKKKKKRGTSNRKKDNADPNNPSATTNTGTVTSKAREMRFNLNFSVRDDISQIYNLATEAEPQADRGNTTIAINPTVEWDVNKNLAIQYYFNYDRTIPKTSLNFLTTNVRTGITLRFLIN